MTDPFGIEERYKRKLSNAIEDTEKRIVKGTVECKACGESIERRVENIEELAEWAEEHAIEAWMGGSMYDHRVDFDADLMPLPEIDDIAATIEVGDVEQQQNSQ